MKIVPSLTVALWGVAWVCAAPRAVALTTNTFISPHRSVGSFPIVANGRAASIVVDVADWPGVIRAARDLQRDIDRVTSVSAPLTHDVGTAGKQIILIGSLDRSPLVARLVQEQKIQVADLAGQWEASLVQVVHQPLPGVDRALLVVGSDKRGTSYAVYDVCEQMGVSPWHFWGDAPPQRHKKLYARPGRYVQGPPAVKYRGIFINDEAPALTEWVRKTYGEVPGRPGVANYGHAFYTNIFDVMLRLRANYLWPAMWNNAFNEDDPENPRLADEYGIVMGTSHQEPMLRAQQEWDRGPRREHGLWDYNKTNQRPALLQFWREGVRRNKNYESIITMGLRAENDSGAPVGKEQTEEIIRLQRQILAEEVNADVTQIPQMWCLYKEVQAYYEDGLRVPDDVTLLWAEDNWGNVRRLPTAAERHRAGGAGIYYHFDYHGGPRSYQWINTSPIAKVWDQMSLAKEYGADRIWIVNVGHFNKGSELPLEFFLNLAWDPGRWTAEQLDDFTRRWATREFGPRHADEIAALLTTYTRFNGRRKPELLEPRTYSLNHYREFETVVADYEALAERAQKVFAQLPVAYRDAFYGYVLYPITACAKLNAMYFAAARNAAYAQQGRASANDYAALTRALFADQTNLITHYHQTYAGGKWDHFMSQTYIGYTQWNPPRQNNLNAVRLTELTPATRASMGVSVEGGAATTGGALAFHKFGQPARYVDIFNRGTTAFEFTATANVPWLEVSARRGRVDKDTRLEIRVNWRKAPTDHSTGQIEIHGAGTNFTVSVRTFNPTLPARRSQPGFIEADGYVAMEAEHFTRQVGAGANRWRKIPNYGHTQSGMRAEGPPEVLATPGKDAPCLEYPLYLFTAGRVEVESIIGPTLGFMADRPLRYAVSFDDAPPQEVTIVPTPFEGHYTNPRWSEAVRNNCHKIKSSHEITAPGYHTLKIWMVDPGVVLQRHIVNTGGVQPSYLGPPESQRR